MTVEFSYCASLRSYEESLEIRRRLATKDPDNTQWQRDLAAIYSNLAALAEKQGHRTEALEWYQQALTIVGKLTGLDPANAAWREDLRKIRKMHDRPKDE